ncbi:MAG: hypothetical protein OXN44_13395 [Acidimicrobiaceae bacterium]|nr:hypothetical protein [Acidimicrobiaceae bacterium]
MRDSLQRQAQQFANDLTGLLNATVANGPTISAVKLSDGKYRIGCGLTRSNLVQPSPISLTLTKKPPLLYLRAAHTLTLDNIDNQWLTVATTSYAIQTKPGKGQGTLFRYDYTHDVANVYPEAHFHVNAPVGEDYKKVFEARGRARDPLSALHFPVGGTQHGPGGTHYRPILEDIIEMLVVEKLVDAHPKWQTAVAHGREKYYETQLKAAVRRNPHIATLV